MLFSLLAALALPVQQVQLVEDLYAWGPPVSSDPSGGSMVYEQGYDRSFAKLGEHWYFAAFTIEHGRELWRTDGTLEGTNLVANINDLGDSDPNWIVAVEDELYFSADDGVHGRELWKSDGTAQGTQLVADIHPGSEGTYLGRFAAFKDALFFIADSPGEGRRMWRSDGTSQGTSKLKDLTPATPLMDEYIGWFTPNLSGDKLYFHCDTFTGTHLFVSDGTVAGTHQVAPDGPPWVPVGMIGYGPYVYFHAGNPWPGTDPGTAWRTDGTAAGTVEVVSGATGQPIKKALMTEATVHAGELYFGAESHAIPGGHALWKTDGTTAGTVEVWSIPPVSISKAVSQPSALASTGDKLFFNAANPATNKRSIHVFNGTSVVALGAGLNVHQNLDSHFAVSGGHYYFTGGVFGAISRVYVSDGTEAGTHLAEDIYGAPGTSFESVQPDWFTPTGDGGLIFAGTHADMGRELWWTSGSGTALVNQIEPGFNTSGILHTKEPSNFTTTNGERIVFSADSSEVGRELHSWTPVGGVEVMVDLIPGSGSSNAGEVRYAFLEDRGVLVFSGLYKGAGSSVLSGPVNVMEAIPGSPVTTTDFNHMVGNGYSFTPGVLGNRFVFLSQNQGLAEMILTDGTSAGSSVLDVGGDGLSSYPRVIGRLDDEVLVLSATTPEYGREVWTTDGTAAGTQLLKDIAPGTADSGVWKGVRFGDEVVFAADDGVNGTALWATDGTAAGTRVVLGPWSSVSPVYIRDFFELEGRLYAFVRLGQGEELWSTDLVSTELLATFAYYTGTATGRARVAISDGVAFFTAGVQDSSSQLWRTDGTVAGTYVVDPILTPDSPFNPTDLVAANGGVYFNGRTQARGEELYFSNGLPGGTTLVDDIYVGPTGSNPHFMTLVGGRILFTAWTEFIGKEVFEVVDPGPYVLPLGGTNFGTRLTATTPRLGEMVHFQSWHVPADELQALLVSLPRPKPWPYLLESEHASWIKPSGLLHVGFPTEPDGSWKLPVPAHPALEGLRVHAQVYHSVGGALPAKATNGLSLSLGW